MRVERIADGLWRWTGLHPEWTEESDWPREVGCVYYEAPDAVVLIDPLVPPEDDERFLAALDRDVERAARPVAILLTTESHARSAQELAARYDARIGERLVGIDAKDVAWGGELAYWIAEHNALVAGDVLLADGAGGIRVPTEWVRDDLDAVLAALRPLLDLPIECILVSHGDPVLARGRDALTRALPPSK